MKTSYTRRVRSRDSITAGLSIIIEIVCTRVPCHSVDNLQRGQAFFDSSFSREFPLPLFVVFTAYDCMFSKISRNDCTSAIHSLPCHFPITYSNVATMRYIIVNAIRRIRSLSNNDEFLPTYLHIVPRENSLSFLSYAYNPRRYR